MTKDLALFLLEAAEYCGNDGKIRDDYSGRGMMGKTTYGIVVDSPVLLLADVLEYIRENRDVNMPDIENFKTDNMGKQIIIY